jgi:cytochrome c biogenesis factor
VFVWQLYATDAACAALPWLLCLGYCMFMGALLVKTFRIWRVFQNSKRLRSYQMRYAHVLLALVLLLLVPIVLLIVWSAVDPMRATLVIEDPIRPSTDYVECELDSGSVGFGIAIALLVYAALLTAAAMLLSIKVWKIDRTIFNESVWILFSVYIIVIAAVVLIALQASNAVDRDALFVIRSLVLLATVFTIVCMICAPKLYYVLNGVDTMSMTTGESTLSRMTAGDASGRQMASGSSGTSL